MLMPGNLWLVQDVSTSLPSLPSKKGYRSHCQGWCNRTHEYLVLLLMHNPCYLESTTPHWEHSSCGRGQRMPPAKPHKAVENNDENTAWVEVCLENAWWKLIHHRKEPVYPACIAVRAQSHGSAAPKSTQPRMSRSMGKSLKCCEQHRRQTG